jgi:hypothetical protein
MTDFFGAPRILAGMRPPPPPYLTYHFFVSYTTREAEVKEILPTIDEFVEELKAAGLRAAPVFFDRFSMGRWDGSNEALALTLRDAICESICMIAFVSPGYVESEWCQLEWQEMARLSGLRVHTLPIVWKEIDWQSAEASMNLLRLPEGLRVVYPRFMHMFFPPKIELMAAEHSGYFPIETYDDRVGWERAVREAYSFIVSRSENPDYIRYERCRRFAPDR